MNRFLTRLATMRLVKQISLMVGGIILILGLAITIYFELAFTRTLRDELDKKGMNIAKNISINSVEPLLTDNTLRLHYLLTNAQEAENDIVYGYIMDASGNIVVHTFDDGFPRGLAGVNDLAPGQDENVQRVSVDDTMVHDIAVSVTPGQTVHVGISEANIDQVMFRIRLLFVGVTIALTALGACLAALFSLLITRPLRGLAVSAAEIGKGNLDLKVPVAKSAEAGVLATAFNKMTADLRLNIQEITESREFLRTLFDGMNEGILIIDRDYRVVDVNPAVLEMTGRSREESIGRHCYEVSHNASQRCLLEHGDCPVEQVFAAAGHFTALHTHFDANGEPLIVEISAAPLVDKSGAVNQVIEVITDVTEHKLLETQLIQSQKMEGIGRLAGGIAHDFRNYLTAVKGYTDLALSDIENRDLVRECLQESRRSQDNAINLTRQLLLFGRRESPEMKPVALKGIVFNMLRMLSRLIGEQYRVVTDLQEELASINADAGHMEQVLMNMVINARDAMPDGGKIVISARNIHVDGELPEFPDARSGDFVELTVSDTGVGMDEQMKSRIFEPFFTTKEGSKGTGLGLSVIYGIVSAHGGWINLESSPGRGSSFHVYLPAIDAAALDERKPPPPAEKFPGRGERVLVVEDEKEVRMFAEKVLRDNGYEVFAAASAEEAFLLFEREKGDFNIVFSDVVLPAEDGVSLVKRLKRLNPDIRILLSSGHSNKAQYQAIRDKGYRFLEKPYAISDLLRTIRELLGDLARDDAH